MTTRKVVSGGYVVSMDPALGELQKGWVVIDGDRIVEVTDVDPGIADAEVIDASGKVVLPGFVDTHRHTWQTQLRGMVADMSMPQFFRSVRGLLSPVFGPDDVYAGSVLGALEALDAGVTTILDYAHTVHSPEHADAGIEGLREAGIRCLYAYGYAAAPLKEPSFKNHGERLADARRVKGEHFSSTEGLLTMGLAITETGTIPFAETIGEARSARELGSILTAHTGCLWGSSATMGIRELHHHGLLTGEQVHAHCNTLSPVEFALLAETGAKVSSTPETELAMGLGDPAFRHCLEHGIEPTLGCDVVSLGSGDLFAQMRLAMSVARGVASRELNLRGEMPETMTPTTRDLLRWGTQNGANALGLGSQVGSLTKGRKADLIVVGPKAGRPHMQPLADPVAAMVTQATASDVETVLVDGTFLKRDFELVADGQERFVRLADESRERILSSGLAGGPLIPPPERGIVEQENALAAANLAQAYALPHRT